MNRFEFMKNKAVGFDGRGNSFVVDVEDVKRISKYQWRMTDEGYVATRIRNKQIFLHRFIVEAPRGKQVDHINQAKNDCRKCNLRICEHSQNMRNRRRQSNNTSGYKGVSKNRDKWIARIKVNGKSLHLGMYDDPVLAHEAYKEAAKKYHGEYACTA